MLTEQALVSWSREFCVAGAGLGCIYLLIASILVLRFMHRRKLPHHAAAAVSVLKPLHGAEPRLFGRLSSVCMQNYRGPVQIVFGTNDGADPAIRVIGRLREAFPEKDIVLRIDAREYGANRKVSNLANMTALAQHDILVVADSDIEVDSNYLARIVGELQKPGVGAVTCLYHGVPDAGVWSHLSAMAINSHFLPQVVMALTFGLAQPCFGSTIAIRRQTLATLGGFAAFADFLAEDYSIGEAVRAAGYEVVIPHLSVGHVCFEGDFKSLLSRQVRFARTIKSIDPVGYAGSIISHPLCFVLLAALLGYSNWLLLGSLVVGCRAVLCLSVEKAFGLPWQHYWLIPLQDLLASLVYLVGFFGATVDWRGHRYRLLPNGSLVQIEE